MKANVLKSKQTGHCITFSNHALWGVLSQDVNSMMMCISVVVLNVLLNISG